MVQPTTLLAFFSIDVQHKTKPDIIPISFYVFKDSTRPSTLLSYAASVHLGIIEFKVPNKANSHAIDSIQSKKKKISFSTPLCYSTPPTKSTPKKAQKPKPVLKQNTTVNITSQDQQSSQVHSLQDHFCPHKTITPQITQKMLHFRTMLPHKTIQLFQNTLKTTHFRTIVL